MSMGHYYVLFNKRMMNFFLIILKVLQGIYLEPTQGIRHPILAIAEQAQCVYKWLIQEKKNYD